MSQMSGIDNYCYLCAGEGVITIEYASSYLPQICPSSNLLWLILCIKLARLCYPIVWLNTSPDIAVKVFFRCD